MYYSDSPGGFGGGTLVALIKIVEPLSPLLNYFEFEIIDRGEKCCIAIGTGSLGYQQVIQC